MTGRRFICVLMVLVVCLSSCKKREHVIPRSKMARIYAEMFVTDQKIASQLPAVREQVDTSWVYEPIFEKYGYTSDDYRASVAYYIRDANRFARIVRRSTVIIENEIKDLKKRKALLEKLEGAAKISYEPERIYYLTGVDNPNLFGGDTLRFYVDSTGGQQFFDPRDWADTAYYGPVMRILGEEVVEEIFEASVEGASEEASEAASGSGTDEPAGTKVVVGKSDSTKNGRTTVRDTLHRRQRVKQNTDNE